MRSPRVGARRAAPLLTAALIASRLAEVRVARRNEAALRARGAVEHGRGHFPLFFVLHPAWLLGLLIEGRRSERPVRPGWLVVALLAQPARRWVMRALGEQFTTRILVAPDARLVTRGPFRLGRHPGYAVVTAELLAAPLALRAPRTAVISGVANAALLALVRMPAEDRALAPLRAAARG